DPEIWLVFVLVAVLTHVALEPAFSLVAPHLAARHLDHLHLRADLRVGLHRAVTVDAEDVNLPTNRRRRLRIDAVLLRRQALQKLHALPCEIRQIVKRGDWLEAVDTADIEQRENLTEGVEDRRGGEQRAL